MAVSKAAMEALQNKYERAKGMVHRMAQSAGHVAEVAIESAETTSMAFALAVAEGRYGPKSIGPVPLNLALAGVLHGLGFWAGDSSKGSGGWESHLHALGNGALAEAAVIKGLFIVDSWKKKLEAEGKGEAKPPEQLK